MIGAFKRWLLAREIDRALKQRRIIRKARSQAAQRGVTTYWKRAAMQARATFNVGANA